MLKCIFLTLCYDDSIILESIPDSMTMSNPGEPLTRPSHEGLLRSHRLSILRLLKWPPTCTAHRRDRGRRTTKGAAVHRRPAFPRRSGADVLGQGRSGIGRPEPVLRGRTGSTIKAGIPRGSAREKARTPPRFEG